MSVRLTQWGMQAGHGASIQRRPHETLAKPAGGVLFDVCNVLYDATLWRRWLLQILGRLGLHTNYRSFFRIWDRDFLPQVHCGRRPFSEAFEEFLLSAGLSGGQINEVEAACQARRRELEVTARPLPGVKATLATLHNAGVVLGVQSDCEFTATELGRRLERIGITAPLTAVVTSIDLGRTKPDPVCYLTALDAMKLPAERVAFVGHDTADLAGAAGVGLQTIAFNSDDDAQADVFINRFDELLELVTARPPYAEAG